MKACVYVAPPPLISAVEGGECPTSYYCSCIPGETHTGHGENYIGVLVGLRAGLDILEKRRISKPCLDSNPDSSDGKLVD
jgi:hypothetical protein